MAVILVTHDLGVIAGRADRMAVMYAGRVVETTTTERLYANPRHPYTEALFDSLPERGAGQRHQALLDPRPAAGPDQRRRRAAGSPRAAGTRRTGAAAQDPQLGGRDRGAPVRVLLPGRRGRGAGQAGRRSPCADRHHGRGAAAEPDRRRRCWRSPTWSRTTRSPPGAVLRRKIGAVSAVADVSFTVHQGETVGLVGESGCGKTTVGKLIVGLETPDRRVDAVRRPGPGRAQRRPRGARTRRRHPADVPGLLRRDEPAHAGAHDPARAAGHPRGRRPGRAASSGSRSCSTRSACRSSALERYPHEFSGGQRQRVGLARALALRAAS